MFEDYRWLRLSCSGCNVQLRVGIEQAGKKVSCPSCSAVRDIPNLAELNALLMHEQKASGSEIDHMLLGQTSGPETQHATG